MLITMTPELALKKTPLQERLETEGWTFIGNFAEDFRAPSLENRFDDSITGVNKAIRDCSNSWKELITGRAQFYAGKRHPPYMKFIYVRGRKDNPSEDSVITDYS